MTKRAGPDLNIIISNVLRWGVIISAVLISAGVAVLIVNVPSGMPSTVSQLVSLNYARPTLDPRLLLGGIVSANPIMIIEAGLLVLLATPIVRVATSVFLFAIERDGLYVAITLFVLAVLLISIFLIGPLEALPT